MPELQTMLAPHDVPSGEFPPTVHAVAVNFAEQAVA
jgi:hypothetical protein